MNGTEVSLFLLASLLGVLIAQLLWLIGMIIIDKIRAYRHRNDPPHKSSACNISMGYSKERCDGKV